MRRPGGAHDAIWKGVARPPREYVFTREQYRAWAVRGMIPRDVVPLWVSCGRGVSGYVLVMRPPRTL